MTSRGTTRIGVLRTFDWEDRQGRGSAVQRTVTSENRIAGPIPGQVRSPWTEWALAIVTLGVYAAVRHHRINRELRDFGVDVDPALSLLAFVPGAVLVVPFLVTVHRTSERIRIAQETVGLTPSVGAWRSAALSVVAFAHVPAEQAALNAVWRVDSTARPDLDRSPLTHPPLTHPQVRPDEERSHEPHHH